MNANEATAAFEGLLDHVAKQAEAERLRDEGMARAEMAADPRLIAMIDGLIAEMNASGEAWSTNSLRDRLPANAGPLVGARVRAAATRRPVEMVRVGYVPSDLPSTHSHVIALWIGADHAEQTAAAS